MKKINVLSFATMSALSILGGTAVAQPSEGVTQRVPAIDEALEISISGSFQQNEGDLADSGSQPDVAGPGGGGELAVGYRITPNLNLAAYGSIAGYSGEGSDNDSASMTAGLKADWHFLPASDVDPWVSLGAGIKGQWIGDREELERTVIGVELAKAQLGVDYRVSPSFAIGPVIGASAAMYTHEETSMTSGYEAIDDKKVSWTFTAGLLGRFDVLGTRR